MGWTYNTVNPNAETNAPTIAAVGISFTTLALILVSLRMYVRLWMIKATGLDDWVIVFTWFMSCGFMVVTIVQSKWGLGLQNLADMPTENIFNFGLLQYMGAPFYITSILGFKLSLLCSFYRITVDRVYRLSIIAIIAACTAFHLSFLLVQLNLCQPISKQWDPAVTTGSCLVAVPVYTSMASLTILFDVIIMLTPFPMLIKTRLPKRKKLILLGIFSLGIFITIIQIIRILTIKSLANYIDSSQLIMWSMVENNLGIMVACIPPLSPLIRFFREKSSSRGTSNVQSGQKALSRGAYALSTIGGKKGFVGIREPAGGQGDMESSTEELTVAGGIHKTTEVVVSRTSSGEEDERRKAEYRYPS
ncbi:hypothetical protein B0O99DRAFT_508895 [Bisporella sp. PMI_857]|nr:hypothetical protein B0O99DRAFT_508895 [Bisporella sp. PMI_857]